MPGPPCPVRHASPVSILFSGRPYCSGFHVGLSLTLALKRPARLGCCHFSNRLRRSRDVRHASSSYGSDPTHGSDPKAGGPAVVHPGETRDADERVRASRCQAQNRVCVRAQGREQGPREARHPKEEACSGRESQTKAQAQVPVPAQIQIQAEEHRVRIGERGRIHAIAYACAHALTGVVCV